jgi:hypothetical protein
MIRRPTPFAKISWATDSALPAILILRFRRYIRQKKLSANIKTNIGGQSFTQIKSPPPRRTAFEYDQTKSP